MRRPYLDSHFDPTHQFRRADSVGVEGSVNIVMTICVPDMTAPPPYQGANPIPL